MSGKERWLVWLLRIGGVATLSAFPFALLPPDQMARGHEALGMGPFPHGAVTDYMARSLALLYGYHGVLTLIVSTDVRRYRRLVGFLGWMLLTFGPAMLLVDLYAGMPWFWILVEGPPLTLFGVAYLWLRRSVPLS